ncbi:unnamed protein product [Leptosia nina]|uniref:RNA-directed DNA polymerase n=1 Tax=Leptosia nina TaxID=320188 RepID=A0AAV1JIB4_9NEOP
MEDLEATSEVTDPPPRQRLHNEAAGNDTMSLFSSGIEAIFKKIADNLASRPQAASSPTTLINFDPDVIGADVINWCALSELIIEKKNLTGVDLILVLTQALKGRATSCLMNIPPDKISWNTVKETLISKFSNPMMMQDHFDQVLQFEIKDKETPAEAGQRLWQLIEKIPDAKMPEHVITGFAISVLSKLDDRIRREFNSTIINDKHQFFRTLRGFNLKRKTEDIAVLDLPKRYRSTPAFNGSCNFCGRTGHRGQECRDRYRFFSKSLPVSAKVEQSRPTLGSTRPVTCYICAEPGHMVSTCPKRYRRKDDATPSTSTTTGSSKQVNACSRASHGVLQISGLKLSFVFDSGSECSLIRQSNCNRIGGEQFHEHVVLKGIGNNPVSSHLQIKCPTTIENLTVPVLYHVLPDQNLSEEVLLGRDILEMGLCINMTNDRLSISETKDSNSCIKLETFDEESVDTDLVGSDKDKLFAILKKYSDYFIQRLPTSWVKTGELKIDLIDPTKTVHRRPYRLSPTELSVVNEKVNELLDANIIRESSSPFASPILLVKKKDGSDRMCVDYRELNSNTRPDSYPLPLINDQIDKLHGAHYFSSLDMASGFHQIKIHEDSIERTAFVTPTGQYEFLTMPFGLKNAPQVFQRAISTALKPLNDDRVLVYMDDVLSASVTIEEGLSRLDKLLDTLSKAGFSYNFKKCSFMKKRTEYLGYVISSGEIRPNPRKIQALKDIPRPKTATQVRQFIGLATYFRQFIPDFSKLMRPLYPLTSAKGYISWTSDQDRVHQQIINYLTNEPVLKIFNPESPTELHTDASSEGYGAVLIQRENNLPHVVAYFSHKTSDAESRYHSYELETLAVVKSVEHFRHYLYGRKFKVFTDCNALKASHSKRDLTPRVHRWWAILQSYDFEIIYKEGKSMAHADFLSRNTPVDANTPSKMSNHKPSLKLVNLSELEKGWLTVEQQRDSEISDIMFKLKTNSLCPEISHTYDIKQNVLYRKIQRGRITKWLPIIPRSLIWSLIHQVHHEIKHLGYEKTLNKLYDLYWFQNMSKYVKKFIDSCVVCKVAKGPSGAQQVRLHPIPKTTTPWHTIHIDLTGKLSGKNQRKEYCSVIIDGFTKFVVLKHTATLNSLDATNAIKDVVCLFGAPKRIIADRGRSYDNSEYKKFCRDNNIELHLIATGSSRANGQVERVMGTLKNLLTIAEQNENSWQEQLGDIQLALNTTYCRVTGYTPIELMFGIQGNSLQLSKISTSSHDPTRLDLDEARSNASNSINKLSHYDASRFNKGKATVKPFSVDDFVFVKSQERHQSKLDHKYKGPFKITAVLDNDRYELRHISGSNRIYKYAHENLRLVPRGLTGFLEVSENCSNDVVTAVDCDREAVHPNSDSSSTLTANSDTLSINSDTMSINSDSEASIDHERPCQIVTEAIVHRSN